MMGGHTPDQRWYWDGKRFATDLRRQRRRSASPAPMPPSRAMLAAPAGAARAAARLRGEGAAGYRSKAAARPVGDGRFARAAGDAAAFRASPAFDGAMLALAAGLIDEMKLGQDAIAGRASRSACRRPIMSATAYGTGGQEMCLQLLSLDRDLGDFLPPARPQRTSTMPSR